MTTANISRCAWAQSPTLIAYHDEDWGVPVHDDRLLFEMLILEGAQAGLNWDTILKKRSAYQSAFANFEPAKVARFTPGRIERLLENPGLVRNRLKIESAVRNAKAFLEVQAEFATFDAYLWGFVDGRPIVNQFREQQQIPAQTERSQQISKDLKRRGFNFVGPTICYAYMQSIGMVNDHLTSCYRHGELTA